MLDRQQALVLNILNKISDGNYKIIDSDDIINKLGKSDVDKTELSNIMRTLIDYELISVKFSTLDEYCLTTLPKARVMEDEIQVYLEAEKEKEREADAEVSEEPKETEKPTDKIGKKQFNFTKPNTKNFKKEIPKIDIKAVKKTVFKYAFLGAVAGGSVVALLGLIIGLCVK